MRLGDLYQATRKTLRDAGVDTPDMDARILISYALNLPADSIVLHPDTPIIDSSALDVMVQKRVTGIPVAKIIGLREFYGLDFIVNEHVLDPRPDTEILIDAVLQDVKDWVGDLHILDICTGSGCIAIALLKHLPNARATATDISPDALNIAQQNAQKHGVSDRITFIQTSFTDSVNGTFDAITCNPPYIRTDVIDTLQIEVKNHDPMLALDGGVDGLNPYREIFPQIRTRLKSDARAYFEMGFDQADDLRQIADDCGLAVHDVMVDLGGNDRVIIVS